MTQFYEALEQEVLLTYQLIQDWNEDIDHSARYQQHYAYEDPELHDIVSSRPDIRPNSLDFLPSTCPR